MDQTHREVGYLSEHSRARHGSRMQAAFIWGPLPYAWFEAACLHGGKSANVALAIWYVRGVRRTKSDLPITPRQLAKFHVTSRRASNLLERFEKAGLISVERRSGRSPRVCILDVPTQQDG